MGAIVGVKPIRSLGDYYFFCDGKLFAPEGSRGPRPLPSAEEQQRRLLGTAGVKEILGPIGN